MSYLRMHIISTLAQNWKLHFQKYCVHFLHPTKECSSMFFSRHSRKISNREPHDLKPQYAANSVFFLGFTGV